MEVLFKFLLSIILNFWNRVLKIKNQNIAGTGPALINTDGRVLELISNKVFSEKDSYAYCLVYSTLISYLAKNKNPEDIIIRFVSTLCCTIVCISPNYIIGLLSQLL